MKPRPPRAGRTRRDWVVDTVAVLLGLLFAVLASVDGWQRGWPTVAVTVEAVLGGSASLSLWLRRRWPVGLAVVVGGFALFSTAASAVALIVMFTVAIHRCLRTAVVVAVAYAGVALLSLVIRAEAGSPIWLQAALGVVCVVEALAWGLYVRMRRQLARTRQEREATEQELRLAHARQQERHRIAREMHDVLAHRLSLLSLHAGALELWPDAPPAEVARAAGVIRRSAHGALEDLRDVVGVLRAAPVYGETPSAAPERPQPTLVDLPRLLDESGLAGTPVTLDCGVSDLAAVPEAVGRTAYRIVQEGLTNARKHADRAAVSVAVRGTATDGLTVEVRNPWPADDPVRALVPGAGLGLVGLAERAALAGGRLEHGRTPAGEFRLRAWLPWSG